MALYSMQRCTGGTRESHIGGCRHLSPAANTRGGDVGRGMLREIWISDALRGPLPDDAA